MPTGIRKQNHQHRQNSGFTLIELLVSIGIIAILAGLLLAGIGAATSSVSNASVANEIKSLETALAQFYAEYGMYPPSSIVLHETGAQWNNPDPVPGITDIVQKTIRSKSLILQIWPNFNFAIDRDLNGNGTTTEAFELNGTECMVFFLGGVLRNGAPIGFSKNATNPFDAAGSNRTGPFHEFQPDRLKVPSLPTGWYSYLDTYAGQQTPILYLSSYDGRGYRNAELPPGMTSVYLQKTGGPAWKEKTYQLISPGLDGQFGQGGVYDVKNKNLLTNEADWDNITNFSSGKLR